MKRLIAIQNELKCNKGQYNCFGKYSYRSCEDILEAVKPLLLKYGCALMLRDMIENIGDRFYVKAIASLYGEDGVLIGSSEAYAREDEAKKGMDGAQVTGASSSYARKYALNGLFCIDDTKDADATNKHGKGSEGEDDEIPQVPFRVVQDNIQNMVAILNQNGMTIPEIAAALGKSEEDFRNGFVNEAAAREIEKSLGLLLDKAK